MGRDQRPAVGRDAQTGGLGLNAETDARVAMGAAVAQSDRPRRRQAAAALGVDIDGVIVAPGGIERIAIRCPHEADVGICLLDDLDQHGFGLVGARHVVQEDVLGRVGRIDRAVRLIERVLTRADDRQRRTIRTELRAHRLAGDEIRVRGQAGIERLLERAGWRQRRYELPGRQPQRAVVAVEGGLGLCARQGGQRQRNRRQQRCPHYEQEASPVHMVPPEMVPQSRGTAEYGLNAVCHVCSCVANPRSRGTGDFASSGFGLAAGAHHGARRRVEHQPRRAGFAFEVEQTVERARHGVG